MAALSAAAVAASPRPAGAGEELLKTNRPAGRHGGRLVIALRAEPKTFNPVTAVDNPSRMVIGKMIADLIHINRFSQKTELALAKSWSASPDGRRYILQLRRGLRFSDGHPLDADDVLFTFQVYLDEAVNSPNRDLLIVGGQPIIVKKLDAYRVQFELAQPYAAAERLFDSLAILPRHLLETAYREGKFAQAWSLNTSPGEIAGLGPFRLKEYVPGQRLVLERNPYYWKEDQKGNRLPYCDQLVFLFVPSEDAQVIRFQSGDTDVLSRFSAPNFAVLAAQQQARGYQLYDLGPALEYNFLFFNLNDVSPVANPQLSQKQASFRDMKFRQAVSAAVDRDAIVRLVYQGRGTALWVPVSPGNKLWENTAIPHPSRSPDRARELLRSAGFSWKADGTLVDARSQSVEFSIVTSASNAERRKMATLIQNDLAELGMRVQVMPLDFRALLDRVFQKHDFEACILALGGGDADPNAEINVWSSSGSTHLWHLGESQPATPWEAEIDRLMKAQLTALRYKDRKRLYDQVQQIIAENLPIIALASPHVLVGAKNGLGNFEPALLEDSVFWNADELFWQMQSPRKP
jgi:peptide/nickel transport system substrate-binding protein